MADIVTQTLVHTVAPLLLSDGLAVANVVGQALLGVAVFVYLFLRILRFISRKLGRDFMIEYTPPQRKPSPWQMVFSEHSPESSADDSVGLQQKLEAGEMDDETFYAHLGDGMNYMFGQPDDGMDDIYNEREAEGWDMYTGRGGRHVHDSGDGLGEVMQ